MIDLVKLASKHGPIYVNPEFVEAVYAWETGDSSSIVKTRDASFNVKEKPHEVVSALTAK